jgi:hypothetical protein
MEDDGEGKLDTVAVPLSVTSSGRQLLLHEGKVGAPQRSQSNMTCMHTHALSIETLLCKWRQAQRNDMMVMHAYIIIQCITWHDTYVTKVTWLVRYSNPYDTNASAEMGMAPLTEKL